MNTNHADICCSVIDTTLRDGEQTAGIVFSSEEKVNMVKAMDRLGIPVIEAGIPIIGESEQDLMRELLHLKTKAVLMPWNRANKNDVLASIACGFPIVHISIPISDVHIKYKLNKTQKWVEDTLREVLLFAKSYGVKLSVGAEDASRAEPEFFLKIANIAADCGAVRIRYADTVGSMEPFRLWESMSRLVKLCPLPIEFHGHNDFGLATANSLAAAIAGVNYVSVTSTGIGERAGNACLEEFSTAMKNLYGYSMGLKEDEMTELTQIVRHASGRGNIITYVQHVLKNN